MSFLKQTGLLLLAALCTSAAPTADECEGLNKTLPAKDLDTIFGDWVLVFAVSDDQIGWDLLSNLSSAHVELKLFPNNKTMKFIKRNVNLQKKCFIYSMNPPVPSAAADSDRFTVEVAETGLQEDGVAVPYIDTGTADYFVTCPDCLMMVYKSNVLGNYLLSYRREGRHRDAELLKAANHQKVAECLGYPVDKPFVYDGIADFCHKKSAPEVEAES